MWIGRFVLLNFVLLFKLFVCQRSELFGYHLRNGRGNRAFMRGDTTSLTCFHMAFSLFGAVVSSEFRVSAILFFFLRRRDAPGCNHRSFSFVLRIQFGRSFRPD